MSRPFVWFVVDVTPATVPGASVRRTQPLKSGVRSPVEVRASILIPQLSLTVPELGGSGLSALGRGLPLTLVISTWNPGGPRSGVEGVLPQLAPETKAAGAAQSA